MNASTLALLQLNDSLFPSGAFTHSYGLEQLVRERLITTPAQVEDFVTAVLRRSLAGADAVAARRAAEAAALGDIDAVVEIDRAVLRTKAAAELRAGLLSVGRRLVEETATHVDDPTLRRYALRLRDDRQLGTQPAAFGVICRALDVAIDDVSPALLFGAANALLQAAMRLMPISHRDTQAALHRLRPVIAELTARHRTETALRAFQPLQEIASMRHARSQARLFAS